MCITQKQIAELNNVINRMNEIEDEEERMKYLKQEVEDAPLFLAALKKVNKNKLVCHKKGSSLQTVAKEQNVYTYEEIEEIFYNMDVKDIANKYTKKQLTEIFYFLYKTFPLSSFGKNQIAEEIRIFLYQEARTKALLG